MIEKHDQIRKQYNHRRLLNFLDTMKIVSNTRMWKNIHYIAAVSR